MQGTRPGNDVTMGVLLAHSVQAQGEHMR